MSTTASSSYTAHSHTTAHEPSTAGLNNPQLKENIVPSSTGGAMATPYDSSVQGHEDEHEVIEKKGVHDGTKGPEPAAAAGGPGAGGRPQLDKYAYHFFSPQMTGLRKVALKILIPAIVLTVIFMWACLPLYWGSLWKSNVYTDKLTVRVIDRDGGQLGQSVSQYLLSHANLGYFSTPSSEFTSDDALAQDVVDEGSWAAITINSGATSNLLAARQNGLSSYNGSSAISVYYSQARSETAVGSYLLPLMQAELGAILGRANAQSIAAYVSSNSGNATAMSLLAQAPNTLNNGFYYTLYNLRPYNQPVATAVTLVGLIYMLIFSFVVTMVNAGVREIISPYLTTRALIAYRLILPPLAYLVLALFFAMVSLPFDVHFDAHFTYAGGFFLWFFTFWLGMCSVGLSLEFAITILTQKFIAFFLIALIIVNVSVASLPHELMPWVFRYQAAMPFWNVGRTVRTIIFNTKNDIAQNLGILLAWTVVSLITITLATWAMRRKEVNDYKRERAEANAVGQERA